MGFIMPAVHIRDNLQLKSNEYSFLMKGVELARGELILDHRLAIVPEDNGLKIIGYFDQRTGIWPPGRLDSGKRGRNGPGKGIVVVDAATVVTTHITEIIKSHVDELLGRQEVQAIIDSLAAKLPESR